MADTLPGKLCHGLAAASSCSPPSPTSTSTGNRCAPSVAFSSSSSSLSCCRSASPHQSAFLGNDAIFFRAMGGSNRTKCWGATLRRTNQFQVRSSTISDDGVKWWEKDGGANVMDVHSAQELTDAVKAAEGKLVIVDFFASWCGSCRALYPKICKLAAEHQDIVFLKVNFDENKPLCKSLNVRVLPYFHFYRGADERVDSFSCSITKLQRLKDAIVKHKPGGQAADTGVVLADADNSEPSMTNIIEEEHTAAGSTR